MINVIKQSAPKKLPEKIYTPNIVENQCASKDIKRSNEAKVVVMAKSIIPGALALVA